MHKCMKGKNNKLYFTVLKIMKKIILFIIFSSTILFQTALRAETAMIGVVNGMVCMECQKKVSEDLASATGEENIIVSWPEGVAIINFSKETTFTEDDFKKVIKDAGFTYGKVASVNEKIVDPETGLLTLKKF